MAVVADLDLLREQAAVARVVEALGGSWDADDQGTQAQLMAGVDSLGSAPSRLAVQEEITAVLAGAENSGRLTRDDVDAIRGSLRLNDGWQLVKRGGLAALPNGQASEAGLRLVARLASIGLFLVTVGELERWFPKVGGHGTKWVADALARGVQNRPDTPVRQFVRKVVAPFGVLTSADGTHSVETIDRA